MKLPTIKKPVTVSKIVPKSKHLKDRMRAPKVFKPIEKSFTDSYLDMGKAMVGMLQIELVKQIKRK